MKMAAAVLLVLALLYPQSLLSQEKIISKEQVDYVFNLTRDDWEIYAKAVFPGFMKTIRPYDTGSMIVVVYPNRMGLYIQPFYKATKLELLVVGSLIPEEFFREPNAAMREDWRQATQDDLGKEYSVASVYKKEGSYHIIDLLISKTQK